MREQNDTPRHDTETATAMRSAGPEQRGRAGGAGRWGLIAAAVFLLGLTLSAVGALLWGSSVRRDNQRIFRSTASSVTATLGTSLRRNADFASTLRAVVEAEPLMSAGTFERWFARLQGQTRLQGGLGATTVMVVPASQVRAFVAKRGADPSFRALVGGRIDSVQPAHGKASCLISAAAALSSASEATATLLQGDWCSPGSLIGMSESPLLKSATDSGQSIVVPTQADGKRTTVVETAIYREGAPVATVAQRRAGVIGWLVSSFDIDAVIREVIAGQHGLAVTLLHTNPGQPAQVVGRQGSVAAGASLAQSAKLAIEGPWRVVVRGEASSSVVALVQELLVFLAGALVSALLSILVLVLARSRGRALLMVQEKTGQLQFQTMHDALTGLPNRVLALDRAEQMLARARRQKIPVAALYVDVDGFKQINDSFGHAAGDELLRELAMRLQGVVREGDTAARLGGDEFIVLVEGHALDAGAEIVAERLLEVLRQPYTLEAEHGRPLLVTASIGIATGLRESADELVRDADLALYEAKAAGKNGYVAFLAGMHTVAQEHLAVQIDLSEALEGDQLFLLYQPIFDLRSESVIGVEALIRWRHPTRGTLAPAEFIPIAEETGMIVPIGRWVLHEACRQAGIWHEQGRNIGISVNVSARQLDGDGLIADVCDALSQNGLDASALTLEVTETTLMRDPEATAKRLNALKDLGVRIAIDDFGTGYSSLAYLRQFPADALKIDRSFISGIATSGRSDSIIHTLVQLGKTLEIDTLAEGIEEQAQLRALQREHCDLGQGFLLARPLDVHAIEAFLDRPLAKPGA
jgi:diguanylate cyclase (GGDEF)-like protein